MLALIDFEREDGQVFAFIIELFHRRAEGLVHFANLTGEDLGESYKDRQFDAARDQVVNNSFDIHAAGVAFNRTDNQIASRIDVKITRAPILNAVGLSNLSDG